MKKFLKTTWAVLLFMWQLPQNLIGLAYLAFCFDRVKITEQRGAVFYATKHVRGGMTLGRYVFIAPGNIDREPVYDHEFGHVRPVAALGLAMVARIRDSERPAQPFLPRGELLPLLHRKVGKSARRRAQLCRGIPLSHGRLDCHLLG